MKNKVIKIIGNLLMIASLIFVVSILISYEIDFRGFFTWSFLGLFIVVVLIYMLTTFLASQNWRLWLELFVDGKLSKISTFQVFAKSNLGKYLPGNIMHYVNRQIFCQRLKIKQSEIASSSILEVLTIMLVGLVLGLLLSSRALIELFLRFTLSQRNLLFVGLGIFAVIVLFIVLFIRLKDDSGVKHIIKCIRRKFFLVTFLKTSAVYVFMYALIGIILYIFLAHNFALSWNQMPIVIAASIISFVIGFITPGVPAGIGVREAVLLFFLSTIAPEYIVVAAAILQRTANIIGEVLAWILSELLLRRSGRQAEEG